MGYCVLSSFACTGLYWSYDWWRSGMFKVLGVEQPKMQSIVDLGEIKINCLKFN